jgi:hypothetical protein
LPDSAGAAGAVLRQRSRTAGSAPTTIGVSHVAQRLLLHYLENQRLGNTIVWLCPFEGLAEEVALSPAQLK